MGRGNASESQDNMWARWGILDPAGQDARSTGGAVRNHWDTGVGDHFNLPGHELANFNFLPFEKVRSSDPFVLEARESYWIEKYGVLEEGGVNRKS